MTLFVGIDPGARGGIAVLADHYHYALAMPEGLELVAALKSIVDQGPTVVGIEKAQAMPGQGVSGMFSYGKGYGFILGALAALGVQAVEVRPQAWQKVMYAGLSADLEGKARSVVAAQALCDIDLVLPRCRKPHDGMADAILIADFMRRSYVSC